MLTLFGLNFYFYGLIVGIALVVGLSIATKKSLEQEISAEIWRKFIFLSLIGGFIGARLHHVLTDFSLYQSQWWRAFFIWQGGLSIIGGLWGAVLASFLGCKFILQINKSHWLKLMDAAVFGLVPAQIIGRLANWVNHELIGLPTKLPWGLYLPVALRPPAYQTSVYFHPLFFYEMVLLLLFWLFINWVSQSHWLAQRFDNGKRTAGFSFILYILYYSVIRFLLDFIRINKTHLFGSFLGINQLFLLGVVLFILFIFIIKRPKKLKFLLVIGGLIIALISFTTSPSSVWRLTTDQQLVQIKFDDSPWLKVELVKTPASLQQGLSGRQQLGSDGMLFIFPEDKVYSFWMKEMEFDLDFVWLNQQQIVEITPQVSAPANDTPDPELMIYQSSQPVKMVLEVEAGQAETWGLEVGDHLYFRVNPPF